MVSFNTAASTSQLWHAGKEETAGMDTCLAEQRQRR